MGIPLLTGTHIAFNFGMAWLEKIKELMQQKGVIQADMARGMGIPAANVHRILQGNRITFLNNLEKLGNFFNVTLQELMQLCGKIPVVAEISEKDGFDYSRIESSTPLSWVPPLCGLKSRTIQRIYSLRVVGNSLEPVYRDGAIIYVKRECYEKIKDADSVIYVDDENRGYLKRVRFSNSFVILENLKSPPCQPMVKSQKSVKLLDLVIGSFSLERFDD